VEAAAEVFSEKGLRGASLDEIADRAGFTRGAIYSNFGSKEELLLAVLDWYSRTTLEAYWEAGRTGEWDPATAARVWSRVVRSDPRLDLLHMEFRLHALRDPSFRRRLAEAHREQVDRIATMVEEQVRRDGLELKIPARDFAELGWAASEGLLLFAAVNAEQSDRYDHLAEELFFAAFAAWLQPAGSQ
jgi:AcrR family transcriptional regulator